MVVERSASGFSFVSPEESPETAGKPVRTTETPGGIRADDEINLAAAAGNNDLAFTRVKAGKILVLTLLSGYNDTSMPSAIRVGYWNGHRHNWLKTVTYPMASETVEFNGRVYLRQGMYAVVRFEGCSSGDDLYSTLNGSRENK